MDFTVMFFIAYTVGTVIGILMGFKAGVRKGADATIEMLMISKFLLFKRQKNGDVEFIRPENAEEIQQDQ